MIRPGTPGRWIVSAVSAAASSLSSLGQKAHGNGFRNGGWLIYQCINVSCVLLGICFCRILCIATTHAKVKIGRKSQIISVLNLIACILTLRVHDRDEHR